MGYIVGKQRVRDSLYVLLQHAQEAGEITKKRREYLLKQCEQLAQELVLLLNHKQSTSLSMADHKRILNTISYVVLQGLEEMEERSLQELEIDACFERGLLVLQDKEQQTRNLLNQLRRNRLPFCNERYNSVMDEQIPHYLEQLSTYEGILYYSHTTIRWWMEFLCFMICITSMGWILSCIIWNALHWSIPFANTFVKSCRNLSDAMNCKRE